MMFLPPLFKLLHVGCAFWFIAGLIGRDISRFRALKASNIHTLYELIELAAFFDRKMVQPGSVFVLVFGLILAPLQGWHLFHGESGNSQWLLVSLVLYLSAAAFIPFFIRRGKRFREVLEASVA